MDLYLCGQRIDDELCGLVTIEEQSSEEPQLQKIKRIY
jgi:hypothetical protein